MLKLLRPTAWVLLVSLLGLYMYCWVAPGHYEDYHPGIRITDELNLAIDYQARSFVAYSDRANGPHRPYYMVSYSGSGVVEKSWVGIYYQQLPQASGLAWTLGISPLYFIAPLLLLVASLEFRAAKARKRQKENTCPSCGYPRQGLQTQTTYCPECGHDLYPPY